MKKLILIAIVVAAPTLIFADSYKIVDLSVGSPFPDASPYGISENGLITGTGTDPVSGNLHAFIYNNGAYQDIGDFGYPYGADGVRINNNGQVAGTGYGPGYNAVLWSNGVAKPIGSIDGGYSAVLGMNRKTDIVGRAVNGDGGGQGYSYINGVFTALNVDIARDINDSDQYVGSIGYSFGGFDNRQTVEHAFANLNGTDVDLGSVGGGPNTASEAFGINNSGEVTGYSTAADGIQHTFLYSNGVLSDLGTFGSYFTRGISINSSGEILGNITTAYGGQIGAFLYENGAMHNLTDLLGSNGSQWSQFDVTQMNDSGWIIGMGTINGVTHGFLAEPVPEPAPLMAIGLGTLAVLRRRRVTGR